VESSGLRRGHRTRRPPMRSPGRPSVGRREDRQRFWEAIARGLPREDAGIVGGVSPVVGTGWFRESGGAGGRIRGRRLAADLAAVERRPRRTDGSLPAVVQDGEDLDRTVMGGYPESGSTRDLQSAWSHISPRNSITVCAARYDVAPVPTSSKGFTSTRSKPTTRKVAANAASVDRSSAYEIPSGSAETQPGTSDISNTSMSRLT
jgi:hypothetical protein